MDQRRGLLILGIPTVAAAALIGLLVVRGRSGSDLPPLRKDTARPAAAAPAPEVLTPAVNAPPPKPASDADIAKATDEARIRSTYQNFRTAVATNNRVLQDALWPAVRKERDFAIRLAQEDLSRAPSTLDREIAQKTLEALRR